MKVKFWKILYFERLSLYFESNETHVSFLMILIIFKFRSFMLDFNVFFFLFLCLVFSQ